MVDGEEQGEELFHLVRVEMVTTYECQSDYFCRKTTQEVWQYNGVQYSIHDEQTSLLH